MDRGYSYSILLFMISHVLLLSFAEEEIGFNPRCPSFPCGRLGHISFPFSTETNPECGLFIEENCNKTYPQKIQLGKDGPWFYISTISQDNTLVLHENPGQLYLEHNSSCGFFKKFTLSTSPSFSYDFPFNRTLFKCPHHVSIPTNLNFFCNGSGYSIFAYNKSIDPLSTALGHPPGCKVIEPQVHKSQKSVHFLNVYTSWFHLQVNVTRECYECHWKRGQCGSDSSGKFYCSNAETGSKKGIGKLALKLGLGIGIVATLLVVVYIIWHRKKGKHPSPNFHSRFTSSHPSKADREATSVQFGVFIFSYSELEEATNDFNHENELGNGGFGAVYHGKLKDGREVAVKRLYEHNYRRVQQFMNEIEILTRLRHKNLVSLYGCTSRHSQGLLLVYEFIPNGTVAYHLHGDQANPCLLTRPIRMHIAIETASALAYLHASEIIHRDVTSNNILFDNNFCVKVADFGLSRLFPTDFTHVSTAPQGTPGYVDPEYSQCYQLTDKSDVYSFGVVLIELISSMSAVDISRHRHEINLANLAVNKIHKRAVDELIDPCLGFHLDEEVHRMATSVAELAFLCLQQNKEMRPSMVVVLEELKRIERGECKPENLKEEEEDDDKEVFMTMQQQPPPSPPLSEETGLLRNIKLPPSPISVTENWVSNSTTPNISN